MNMAERFTKQHEEIVFLCQQLKNSCAAEEIERDASLIHGLQESFGVTLGQHLLLEDSALYPSLLESRNLKIRQTAEQLQKEVQVYADLHAVYQKKYASIDDIRADITLYIDDTHKLLNLILQRIHKEDIELYPLLK